MKGSEIVSVVWIVFYAGFAAAALYFADNNRNKVVIERAGAWIFTMIAVATIAGAYAPWFCSTVLGIWWYKGSLINSGVIVASIIVTWAIAFRAWEWLAALAAFSLVAGGISWVTVHYLL